MFTQKRHNLNNISLVDRSRLPPDRCGSVGPPPLTPLLLLFLPRTTTPPLANPPLLFLLSSHSCFCLRSPLHPMYHICRVRECGNHLGNHDVWIFHFNSWAFHYVKNASTIISKVWEKLPMLHCGLPFLYSLELPGPSTFGVRNRTVSEELKRFVHQLQTF